MTRVPLCETSWRTFVRSFAGRRRRGSVVTTAFQPSLPPWPLSALERLKKWYAYRRPQLTVGEAGYAMDAHEH